MPARQGSAGLIALALLTLHVSGAWAQATPPAARPAWLQAKIAEYERLPPFVPPRSIVSMRLDGKTTYYVSSACCDIPSELYDEAGQLICYPGGGFAGGDGRCPSFVLSQQAVTPVWRDGRGATAASASAIPAK